MTPLECGYFAQCVEDADHEGPHRASDFGGVPEWVVPTMEPAAFDHPAVAVKAAAGRFQAAQERASEPAGLDAERLAEAMIKAGLISRLNDYGYEAHRIAREEPGHLARLWAEAIFLAAGRLTASAAAQERPAEAALRAIEALGEHPDSRYHTEQTRNGGGHSWRCIPIVDAIDALAAQPSPEPDEQPAEKGDAAS